MTTTASLVDPAASLVLPAGLVLRPAVAEDLEAVQSLVAAASLPTEGIEDQLAESYVVATSPSGIAGVAGVEVHGRFGLLRSVAVAAEHRGEGIGQALVANRVEWAKARGLHELYLLTNTAPDFFAALGFTPADRAEAPAEIQGTLEFRSLCPSSCGLMRRALGDSSGERVREIVRARYGEAARSVKEQKAASCCSGGSCTTKTRDPITVGLYDESETSGLPAEALLASLGCGNPTALAELRPGEVVLDLGSGGGIDVLLSARRVGPTGKAYGLDMTDDMLALAHENQRKAGVENVEFLKGEIEAIPLPGDAVDVIISNCVINLSADKGKVLAEAFRVLRPGGRFAVSDIVLRGTLPEEAERSLVLWTGCVAGALQEEEYRNLLAEVGFESIEVEPTRIYRAEDARDFLASAGIDPALADAIDEKVMSAFVRATKPRS